ncbi:glycosyl transferase family 2 [Mycolicibacterium canariasense]|uniref:Glycosyl transferase family 2 n=2 Tax=Mycolicibacterium canariasense TaxID=228230 RepID=A0A100W914_MYCCR|nr:glycosyl transferase family 2 [Mycolicibacterium canariasense]
MLICGYRWWTEPVMADEGYGLGLIPIGLATLAVIAVAGSWNAFALRVARRVGEGEVQRRPLLVGEAVAMGPLSVITLLLLVSNQTMAVWLFIFIGVPLLFVGFLIAATPPWPKTGTMGDDV